MKVIQQLILVIVILIGGCSFSFSQNVKQLRKSSAEPSVQKVETKVVKVSLSKTSVVSIRGSRQLTSSQVEAVAIPVSTENLLSKSKVETSITVIKSNVTTKQSMVEPTVIKEMRK